MSKAKRIWHCRRCNDLIKDPGIEAIRLFALCKTRKRARSKKEE
jgi:hypothetical protein